MTFKPMLAAQLEDKHPIRFPVMASPKLDGVRALVMNGVVVSRSLKPIPNPHVQALFAHLEGLDGELTVGSATAHNVMQATTSGVMSHDGTPDVTFHVFDCWDIGSMPFWSRFDTAEQRLDDSPLPHANVRLVPHRMLYNQTELDSFESACLAVGYEGAMLRDPGAAYKHGRATAKKGELLKVKRFQDDEALVVGFEERMHNGNAATVDALGHTERSSHKANLVPLGDLGALVCSLVVEQPGEAARGVRFNIGTGFTAAQRVELWAQREQLVGKLVKFRHFAVSGTKDAPRHPVFVGFRSELDL